MGRKLALLLGNSTYRHRKLRRLVAPQDDVLRLCEVLRNREVCGFDEVRLKLDATLVDVKAEIGWLLRDRELDDLIFLYFSGHGIKDSFGTFYLALTETDPEDPDPGSLDEHWLRRALANCSSQRIVVVLDACYSGGLIPEGFQARAEDDVPLLTKSVFNPKGHGRFILAATTSENHSFEKDGQSLYTREIIDGLLGGAARGSNPEITVFDLHSYVVANTAKTAPASMRPQLWCDSSVNPEPLVIARSPLAKFALQANILANLISPDQRLVHATIAYVRDLIAKDIRYSNSWNIRQLAHTLDRSQLQSKELSTEVRLLLEEIRAQEPEGLDHSPASITTTLSPSNTNEVAASFDGSIGNYANGRDERSTEVDNAAAVVVQSPRIMGGMGWVATVGLTPGWSIRWISLRSVLLFCFISGVLLCAATYFILQGKLSSRARELFELVESVPPLTRAEIFRSSRDVGGGDSEVRIDPVTIDMAEALRNSLLSIDQGGLEITENFAILTLVFSPRRGEDAPFQSKVDWTERLELILKKVSDFVVEYQELIGRVTVVGYFDSGSSASDYGSLTLRACRSRVLEIQDILIRTGTSPSLLYFSFAPFEYKENFANEVDRLSGCLFKIQIEKKL